MKKDEFVRSEIKSFIEKIKVSSLENNELLLATNGGATSRLYDDDTNNCRGGNCATLCSCSKDSTSTFGGPKLKPLRLKL